MRVSTWTNALRYEVGIRRNEDVESFMRAAKEIRAWWLEICDMSVAIESKVKTPETRTIEEWLNKQGYAAAEAYRYNSASIRVRVVDSRFSGKSLTKREELVFPLIEQLPEDIFCDVTMLLLVTPEELNEPYNLVNLEFDHPQPSSF